MRVSGAITMRLGRSRSPMRTGVKRGWTDMTTLLDKGSSGDDDFADLLARLDEAMGVSDPVERKGSWDRRRQRPVGEAVADEALQRREPCVVPREIREG